CSSPRFAAVLRKTVARDHADRLAGRGPTAGSHGTQAARRYDQIEKTTGAAAGYRGAAPLPSQRDEIGIVVVVWSCPSCSSRRYHAGRPERQCPRWIYQSLGPA